MNEYRYIVYSISKKKGIAKVDTRSNDIKSVYMVVQDMKENKINGYVFDTSLCKVSEYF